MTTRIRASLHPTRPGKIALEADYLLKDLIRSIPGASWSKADDGWSVPLSWSSCLALRGVFQSSLEIAPDLNEWAAHYQETVIAPSLSLKTLLEADGDEDLYGFQRAGVVWLSQENLNYYLLEDEPGSGKTVQTIRALKARRSRGEEVFPVLVVAPNSVKRSWAAEFAKWWPESEGGPRVSVVDGSAAKRRKQLEPGVADVYVINWEALRTHSRLSAFGSIALRRCVECGGEDASVTAARCSVHIKELNVIGFKTVVADEVHRAKDPASQTARALYAVAHTDDVSLRIGLTGTPVTNSPTDLWALLHYLNPKEWPTKVKWVDRYIHYAANPWGGMTVFGLNKDTMEEFHRATAYFRRGLPKSMTLPFLPPIVPQRREADMAPAQRKVYEQMRDHLMARLDDGSLLTAANPMVQASRLIQFANAHAEIVMNDRGDEKVVLSEPSGKIDAFMSDVLAGDYDGHSVIVFAQSKQLINLLSERMKKEGISFSRITGDEDTTMRQKSMDDFQEGKVKFVLCTLGAGSTGITLTKGSVMVFLQRSHSPTEMTQAYNRGHRIGSEQHDTIFVIHYVTTGTAEESVFTVLDRKDGFIEEVSRSKELLRAYLEGTL